MAIWWSSSSMEDANDWDLHAVVRGCSSTASTALDPFCSYPTDRFFVNEEFMGEDRNSFLPDLAATGNVLHELEELCKPFLSKSQQLPQERVVADLQQAQEEPHRQVSQTPRSKRRKNQQKKVACQVPADGLSSDMWAWRKYGQKPIKGSPYPRGYYRCSSSKGCLARKQVERSRADPTMLIITYTAEHNHPVPTHRNALAGSTRNKFPPPPSKESKQNLVSNNKPSSSPLSTLAMTGLSPTTPLTTSMEDELLTPKGDVEEENDNDEEEEGLAPVGNMMSKDDLVFMDSEKLGDDIDNEDFVNKFFTNIWQIEGSANHSR